MRTCPVLVFITVVVTSAGPASAQEAIDGALTRIDFAGYAGDGLDPTPAIGQVDSDTFRVTGMSEDSTFGGTFDLGDFAEGASSGGVTGDGTGGLWAFVTSPGDPAFGFQQTGDDFTPGAIFVRFVNATGAPLVDPTIRYEIWTFNDATRASVITFAWSQDGSTFASVDALTFTSPEAPAATPAWQLTTRAVVLAGVTIAAGGQLQLRFTGDNATGIGGYDELAIDDIEIEVEDEATAPPAACGDGVVDLGEECDDGGTVSGDGCSAGCAQEDVGPSTSDDEDGDGIPDADDNCPTFPNPGQADQDDDGAGNACDALDEGGDGADGDGGYVARGCAVGGGGEGAALALFLLLVAVCVRGRVRG